ncbi:MAG: hypothetical protein AB1757_27455 [Acidobacteriota bacterium]
MSNSFISQQSLRDAPGPKPAKKLYSMAALMRGKNFAGNFETAAGKYEFVFVPTSASLNKGRLELTGSLGIASSRGKKRQVTGVRASLLSIQSGLGNVPDVIKTRARAAGAKSALPVTEASQASGYVGVMYMRFAPIDGKALGLAIDLSSVQLNARLFADSQIERQLRVLYSDLISLKEDAEQTAKNLASLNQIFGLG